jgi:pullulanase/glycogen debranching enzyme
LGVTLDGDGVNVAVFSAHADAIEFCLFDDSDRETHNNLALIGTATYTLRSCENSPK